MICHPPSLTLFPYTTLFRSEYNVTVIPGQAGDETFYDWKTNTLTINPEDHMDSAFVAGMWCAGFHHDSTLMRSEEHTSELQSHSDLVCRLVLEKKTRRRL